MQGAPRRCLPVASVHRTTEPKARPSRPTQVFPPNVESLSVGRAAPARHALGLKPRCFVAVGRGLAPAA